MDTLSVLYDDLGITDRAAVLAADNLTTSLRSSGGHPTAAAAKFEVRLAQALTDSGKAEEATRHLRNALQIDEAVGDRDPLQRAEIYFELARAAYDGNAAERKVGTENLRQALDIVQHRDPDNPLRGAILDYLARYAKLNEDFGDAEHWLEERLAFETARGLQRNAFAIGDTYLVLGDFQAMIGRYRQAEANLRKAVGLLSQSAGPNHPETADARARLGEMLFAIGHRTDAEALLQDALQAQLLTPVGVDEATETRKTLGVLELTRGHLSEAERVLRQNLILMKDRPDKVLRYAVSASNLSAVLAVQGQLPEARSLYEQSLQVLAHHIGENTIGYARALDRGGVLALAEGKPADAVALFQRVVAGWPPTGERFPEQYTRAILGLAAARLDQGSPEDARREIAAFLQKLSEAPERAQLVEQEAQGRRLLGESLRRLGRAREAEAELRRAVELRQSLDDPDSPWLAQARINLATCLLAEHQTAEAQHLLLLAAAAQSHQPLLNPAYRRELEEAMSASRRIRSRPAPARVAARLAP
ncbi:MAG: tetratricopeptide repeat protein [Sinobacteraceae bacterium]|nr:tetratricopeptide repeat protein [Nevskiaceae bacterium]